MAFTYTTGRGETYYLHTTQVPLRDGQLQQVHYFAPVLNPEEAVDSLPIGYSVAETRGAVRLVRSETAERIQVGIEEYGSARKARRVDERRKRADARARSGHIDWLGLAHDLGITDPDSAMDGGDVARDALERIIGEDNIRRAVDLALAFAPGSNLAESVLGYVRSERASALAYEAYTVSEGERARNAVRLIAEIQHPKALGWVEELLGDDRVAQAGVSVLSRLVLGRAVAPDDPRVEPLVALAAGHQDAQVRRQADKIRGYLAERRNG